MVGFKYTMTREMYNSIKFGLRKNDKKLGKKEQKMLSEDDILKYVNDTFGLCRPVYEIVITD
jgi:hypothetical protein